MSIVSAVIDQDNNHNVNQWCVAVKRKSYQKRWWRHIGSLTNMVGVDHDEYYDTTMYKGNALESFISFCLNVNGSKPKSIYINGLGGIYGQLLVDYLSKNGFILVQNVKLDANFMPREYFLKRVDMILKEWETNPYFKRKYKDKKDYVKMSWSKSRSLNEYSFIKKDNSYISITIGQKIVFKDSLRIISGMSIGEMSESLKKGIFVKDKGLVELTDNIESSAFVLNHFLDYFLDDVLTKELGVKIKLTAGATAYNEWINIMRHDILDQNFEKKEVATKKFGFKVYEYYHNKKKVSKRKLNQIIDSVFEQMFPNDKQSVADFETLRPAYKAGLNMVNPKFQGKVIKGIRKFDINSSYLKGMVDPNNLYPIGKKLSKKPKGKSVSIITFQINKTVKNHNGMPFIPVRMFNKTNRYYNEVKPKYNGKLNIQQLTDVEFEQFKKQYKVKPSDITILDQCWFSAISGDKLFKSYKDKFYDLKVKADQEGDEPKRNVIKRFLVALYGYFARRTVVKSDYLTQELEETSYKGNDLEYENTLASTYLPIGIFITAYMRMELVKATQRMWMKFGVYCDTDSIWCLAEGVKLLDPEHFKIDQEKLGYWKVEADDGCDALFDRAKEYTIYKNGKWDTKIAGYDFKGEKVKKRWATFKDMLLGFDLDHQTRPKREGNMIYKEYYTKRFKALYEQEPIADGKLYTEEEIRSYLSDLGGIYGE